MVGLDYLAKCEKRRFIMLNSTSCDLSNNSVWIPFLVVGRIMVCFILRINREIHPRMGVAEYNVSRAGAQK